MRVSQHGTYNEYSNYGCRCAPCKVACRDNERLMRADPVRWANRLAWQREQRRQKTARAQAIKLERGCMDCGYREHAEALDFDHRGGKRLAVSALIQWSWEAVEAEIAKCDVVCANCHRVRTAQRRVVGDTTPDIEGRTLDTSHRPGSDPPPCSTSNQPPSPTPSAPATAVVARAIS